MANESFIPKNFGLSFQARDGDIYSWLKSKFTSVNKFLGFIFKQKVPTYGQRRMFPVTAPKIPAVIEIKPPPEKSFDYEILKLYEQENAELKKYSDELEKELDAIQKENDLLQTQLEMMGEQLREKESSQRNLKASLEAVKKNAEVIIPKHCTYKQLADWVARNFADRLLLSARALRSLKNAAFKDVRLVWQALEMLATEYWNMRNNLIPQSEFQKRLDELHLEEEATISDNRAGERDDTYFLIDDRGKRRKLDRHLKKGRSHNEKTCLRIYFYWDDDRNLVVVGDLPKHLETRQS